MISREEMNPSNYDLTDEQEANQAILFIAVNKIRTAWGKPMIVTSGVRSLEDHLRIYREKAEAAGVPFDQSKVPMHSKHLIGAAVDIADDGLQLTAWLKANPQVLKDAGLYCEAGNANWVHFQCIPPASGHLWFNP